MVAGQQDEAGECHRVHGRMGGQAELLIEEQARGTNPDLAAVIIRSRPAARRD